MAKGMQGLMKQAQQMQQKISTLQKELEKRELEVSSGGGAIKITITGKQEIQSIKIDPEAVDPSDVETLEDLVLTAVNQAVKESQDMVSNAMGKVTGGLNIPGLF
ncbi:MULTISPECIES: YbaB/EbfC family nucleoid-associated protein [Halobacteriovorax]|uniref:Nucleoid-associated protein DAY19_04985 n=1 Tax=Halobacteriovorax vibrionivorans TaxID=2152716 RepID=A0ABY0INS7_9BACT|nr:MULTISPECIES: YbaB/EbfC family nucleoid-associated protein [Halobacteriovorax]AYF43103.1 DNA-binding protein, YbaB/EbfC family [Halobacteriovorax sp. BALOs_7]RZF23124.1 YbaB/EbfC family nucleoid-associated protein [Halobacteriovorax vibrionivorans]TGD49244.1 YbaB/EbfC family nucleoid-associated protein [Halobacteriovorax sp. Y22]